MERKPKRQRVRGSKKGRQAAHHKATHKYERQRERTTRNKSKARALHHPNDLQARK